MPNQLKISPEIIKAYQEEISRAASPATAKRKEISLNRYFDWAKKEGHLEENPLEKEKPNTEGLSAIQSQKTKNNFWSPANFVRFGILGGLVIIIFLLTRQTQFAIPFVFTPAKEGIPESKNQSKNNTDTDLTDTSNSAISAGNGNWNLYAKLQLSDQNGNPMVGSQTLTFKLFKSESDSTPLWTSSPTTVAADSNGSGLVSLDAVPTNLFFENQTLFLGFQKDGSDSKERVPVSTANIPSNLGGYYAAPLTGATPETVPVISSDGSLLLASESPSIKATTGNFLVEGQAVTLKTADGGDGNIEVNPDGKGIVHFLFEGTGQNYLNAQAPNLTSGSLFYGIVANNSAGTGYDLLRLQSGSKPITRLSVDGVGNTYIGGNLNVAKDIKTSGTTRLTSTGALTNITGYSQNSGNFVINQNPGDFGSITKKGTALSDVLTLTLDERGKPANANTDYSTLVLRRYDGWAPAAALHVDEGNAIFDGQLQLGRFPSLPTAIGQGTLVFNTGDSQVYVWDGTTWVAVGSGATINFDDIGSGTNTTATMVVGSGATLNYSGTGTINATTLNSIADTSFLRSDTSDNFTSGTLTTDAGTTFDVNGDLVVSDTNITLDGASTTFTSSGDITLNIGGGDLIFTNNQTFNVGGNGSDVAYNAIGDSTAGASVNVDSDDDLYIEGNLEVDGTIYGNGSGLTSINADTLDTLDSLQFLRSDTSDNYTSGTLTTDAGTTVDINGDLIVSDTNVVFDGATTTFTTTGDLTINSGGGQVIFADTNTLNVGGKVGLTYNAFANVTDSPEEASISSDNDLYIGGDLEVDGIIYGAISGSAGSVAWDDISSPADDLNLTMAAFNTLFDWDPGADSVETNFSLTTQGEDSLGSDEDQVLLALSQTSNGTDVDEAADALLTLANDDPNDPVNSAIRFDAGAAGVDFTFGVNFDNANIGTAEIVLENSETIDNQTDGTVLITSPTTQTSGNLVVAGTSGLSFTGVGGDITFTNSEKIDNDVDGTIAITAPTTSLSGVLTVNGVSGNAIDITNTGITTDIVLQNDETIDNDTDGTILITSPITQTSGNLTVAGTGGLTLSGVGGDITFANAEKIDNDTDGTIAITAPVTSLSGVLTINGTSGSAIEITDTGITTDIVLQNDETIDNNSNGVVTITSPSTVVTGDLTVSGGDITGSSSDSIDIGELADATFTFLRNDTGVVTITANDNDTTAALTILPGGAAALTLGGVSTTAISLVTDGTGNAEVVLPNDSVGPNEVFTTGQTDEYCLTYESTGATWEWQTCGTGSAPEWSDITDPSTDLTLTMANFNTTFNWDPTADAAETNFVLTTQGEDTIAGGDEDQVLLALSQTSNGTDVDQAADALITLANNDANDPVGSAIRFDAGAAGVDFTYGINFDAADIGTAELILENGETIDNQTNGVITISGDLVLTDTNTVNGGGLTGVTYNSFANGGEAPEEASISSDNDLYIGGDLEVDGVIYGAISGSAGSVAWDDITSPGGDLTLTMGVFNTTFNWDPTADSAESAFSLTIDGEDTTAGGDEDQTLLSLSQTDNGANVDEAADSLLTLANNDANDPVNSAIRFDAGAAGVDFTYGINFDAANIGTAEIVLENAEQIHNQTDGTITFEDGNGTDYLTASASTVTIAGLISANGVGTHDIAGTLNLSGNTLTSNADLTINAGGGNILFGDGDTLNVGGKTAQTYNFFADNADAPEEASISSDDDLYIGGDLEVDGTIFGNGSGLTAVNADTLDSLDSLQFLRSDTSDNYTSGTLTFDAGTTVDIDGDLIVSDTDIVFDGVTTTFTTTGDLTLAIGGGDLIFNDASTINIGGFGSDVAYNVISDSGGAPTSANINSDDDLYIEGNLEIDGSFYTALTPGSVTFIGTDGLLTQDNSNFFFDDASNELGIGTNSPDRSLHVETNTAATNTVTYQERLTSMSTGTAANGIGAGLEFETEDSAGNAQLAAAIEGILSNVTSTKEQGALVIKTADQGSTTLNEAARFTNQGDLVTNGHIDISPTSNSVDIYTYDTTKDTDGGLWRNDDRAKASSWYNEAKDDTSANCDITTMDRCGRNDFPEKAFIVASAANVYIYDAKDNTLWMRFDQGTDFAIGVDADNNPSSVWAQNGKIYIGTNGAAATGAYVVNLKTDKITRVNATDARDFDDTIDGRNTDPGTAYPDQGRTGMALVSAVINDVHAKTITFTNGSTVGGNGESYMAVATNDGVSLVKETDQVTYDFVETAGDNYNQVWIDGQGNIWATNTQIDALEKWANATNQSSDQVNATTTWDETTTPALTSATPSIQIAPSDLYVTDGTSTVDGKSPTVYVGTDLGMTALNTKVGDETNASVKYYTNAYITEEMIGDIRAMWPLNGTGEPANNDAVTDVSVNANVLTVKNDNDGADLTYASGIRGTGITFGGDDHLCSDANNDDTCDSDSSYAFGTGSFSISTWFRHGTSIPSTETLIDRTTTATPADGDGFRIYMNGTTGTITFGIDNDGTSFPSDSVTSNSSYADNVWHHLVAVKNGTTSVRLYIDGQEVGTADVSITSASISDDSTILSVGSACGATGGADCATGTEFWNGSIDDLTMTAEALTNGQIKRLATVGLRSQQNHTSSRITGVTGADTYQQLLGNGTAGVSSVNTVTGVGVDSSNQFVYVGLNHSGGATGGLSVIGIDSDSAVDLYANGINTTKIDDSGSTFDASDITAFSVTGTPCSIGYNSGSTNCQSQVTLGILGEASDGTTTSWLETTDYSLYAALAQLTSPDTVKNNVTVNNVFQVFNTVNNITDSTTGEEIQTPSFSVDSNGYVVYNYLGSATGTAWDINDSVLTTGTLFDINSSAITTGKIVSITAGTTLTTGNALNITSATYSPAAAETGSLVNLSLTDTSANTSGNSIVNGLSIATTLNTTGATGTKELNALNVAAPTFTGCSGGNCTWSGLKVNPTTTSAATITEIGVNIGNVTGGAGTETGLSIGSGWDTDLSFVDTSPLIASGNGFTMSFSDGTQNLVQISDQGTTARLAVSDSLQVGGLTTVAYSRFGTAAATHSGNLTVSNDVMVSGDLELDGVLYLDGENISDAGGTSTIVFAVDPTAHNNFNTLTNGGWLVENPVSGHPGIAALMVNQARNGAIISASASGTTRFHVANNGTTTITTTQLATVASLVVNDSTGTGTGKIDVGAVDPPYTINGEKYATYMSAMVGMKEEVTGQLNTNEYVSGIGYRNVIDFNSLPEGSDLWLFGKTTDIKSNINRLVALVTPSIPTRVWYEVDEANKKLAIYSARPTKISYRLTAPRFDDEIWSNRRDQDSEVTGYILDSPDNANNNPIATTLQNMADFTVQEVQGGFYTLRDSSNNIVDGIESIGSFVAGNIKSGAIQSQKLATHAFTAVQGTVDNLLVTSGLVSPVVKTNLISPLAGETDLDIKIGNENGDAGKLSIKDGNDVEVASIDTEGNATFSGEIKADSLASNDIYAGKIYADEIVARNGNFENTNTASLTGVTRQEIEDLLNQAAQDQSLLNEASSWNLLTATDSASLDEIAVSDLYVTDQAAINSLSVTNSIALGGDLVINSLDNSFNSLTTPLRIQSLALAPVEIMAGKIRIETNGDVAIQGNVSIAGKLNVEGDVDLKKLSTESLVIASAEEATNSGEIIPGDIETNTSVGKGIIPAGSDQITVTNSKVNDYSLIYVTPTSSTENKTLYVKSKGQGFFTVGFTEAVSGDVNFNWWIVDTQ